MRFRVGRSQLQSQLLDPLGKVLCTENPVTNCAFSALVLSESKEKDCQFMTAGCKHCTKDRTKYNKLTGNAHYLQISPFLCSRGKPDFYHAVVSL